ncbi:MAG: hypothetical protein ACTHOG_12125 [Marmoricola sp.]
MTKLIFALHGSGAIEAALALALRRALADAGASAVQVNVDDDDVAPALRFGPGEPITALVFVWTDGDERAVVDAVRSAAGDPDADGYRVTERVRLDPAPMPDGTRSDVMAQVALLRRPESMSHEDYMRHWMLTHTAVAIRTQNTSAYVQNVVEEALTPGSPTLSAIVEEHFPMEGMTDPHAFYGSGGDEAELNRRITELMTSVAAFGADQGLDLVPTSRYFWSLS